MRPSISLGDLPGKLPSLLHPYAKDICDIHLINGLFGGAPYIHGATFCIFFANGTRLKARYWPKDSHIHFQMNVVERLPRAHFPIVLVHSDHSTLEQWIEGESIRDSRDELMIMESGRLLGLIHRTPPPDSSPDQVYTSIQEYEFCLIEGLDQLRFLELVDEPFARRVQSAAITAKPCTVDVGLIHRDFCGDNLVISNHLVCCIDNTTFSVGPFDADLARTWYRWKLPAEYWRMFLQGYTIHRDSTFFREHEIFWKASVLVRATLMRFRSGLVDQAMIPLNQLRELCF